RWIGGGTCGGLVSTAWIGSPCGGPKSPRSEATDCGVVGLPAVPPAVGAGLPEHAASAHAARAATTVDNGRNMGGSRWGFSWRQDDRWKQPLLDPRQAMLR